MHYMPVHVVKEYQAALTTVFIKTKHIRMLCFHNRILRFFSSLRQSHCCSHLNTNIPFQPDFSSEGES